LASDEEIYADETYYVSSGTSWATRNLTVDGVLFIDGEVHVFRDVKGTGAIKGSGILRLEV
jgi:uncharacterized protein YjhX (UPF0386 family)